MLPYYNCIIFIILWCAKTKLLVDIKHNLSKKNHSPESWRVISLCLLPVIFLLRNSYRELENRDTSILKESTPFFCWYSCPSQHGSLPMWDLGPQDANNYAFQNKNFILHLYSTSLSSWWSSHAIPHWSSNSTSSNIYLE